MYPNDNPSDLLPDEHDLEEAHDGSSIRSPFYKGCLIVIAILVILSLVIRLYI